MADKQKPVLSRDFDHPDNKFSGRLHQQNIGSSPVLPVQLLFPSVRLLMVSRWQQIGPTPAPQTDELGKRVTVKGLDPPSWDGEKIKLFV